MRRFPLKWNYSDLKTLARSVEHRADPPNALHGWSETDSRRRGFPAQVSPPSDVGTLLHVLQHEPVRASERAGPKTTPLHIFLAPSTKCQNLLPSGGFCWNTVGPLQVLKGSGSFSLVITEIARIGEHDLSLWPTRRASRIFVLLNPPRQKFTSRGSVCNFISQWLYEK